jgi:hypothetical protein
MQRSSGPAVSRVRRWSRRDKTSAGGEEKQLNPKYYAAAGRPKQIWEIPEASHTGGITSRPKEYEQGVIDFFDDALLDGSA